ncbi:MAG: hypothetical protein NTX59_02595 [Elusimicrobia bacterium]|nr:hypothetical protein [Elusimicrobiota bacterium]
MNIQIDIDGTIDKAPEFFKWLTRSLRADGHKVFIVSSRTSSPRNDRETAKELEGYGVVYDKLILSPELKNLDSKRFPPDMNAGHKLYIHKLFAAEDNGIEILFDDCGITTELFRKHLPEVKVFRPLP